MKDLIIFHYHFLPGGVTDVVAAAVNSYLENSSFISSITIVSGRADNIESLKKKIIKPVNFEILNSLDYLEKIPNNVTSETIKKELLEKFSSDDNVWWIHNYHLGKNPYFTRALIEISRELNQQMIYHIHDFPECSRYPLLNRLKREIEGDLYPQNQKTRYVVINMRDFNYLVQAGMNREIITLLENPITTTHLKKDNKKQIWKKLSGEISLPFPMWKPNMPYMLYPVRSIRRKNIAEAALIASLTDTNLIVTLPGVSDTEKKYSEKCRDIFTEGLAPGMFGIGFAIDDYSVSFDELISGSSLVISSSVQEGFGYLFLNSMNWGKALFAKDLDILESFKISFEGYPSFFYDQFSIHLENDEKKLLKEKYKEKIDVLQKQLGTKKTDDLKHHLLEKIDSENTDFSYLTMDLQLKVLKKLRINTKYKNKCKEINIIFINKVKNLLISEVSPNHQILKKNWSYETYCRKTEEILQSFNKFKPFREQNMPIRPINERMQSFFATPEYLRLLYDE